MKSLQSFLVNTHIKQYESSSKVKIAHSYSDLDKNVYFKILTSNNGIVYGISANNQENSLTDSIEYLACVFTTEEVRTYGRVHITVKDNSRINFVDLTSEEISMLRDIQHYVDEKVLQGKIDTQFGFSKNIGKIENLKFIHN